MLKLASKIATPIILAGIFAIVVFIGLGYQQFEPIFYIVVLLLVIYVFFFGFAIGQDFSSPIKKILDKATELSKGNLSSRVYLETKDELSELAGIFNKIAEELEVSRDQEANTEKSVNVKVKAKTKDLEEIINALEQKVKNRTIELQRLIEETTKLKKELNDFQHKIGGYKRPKMGTPKQEE